eukprot:2309877-Pyramimonas_sp.AAC.1
MPEIIPPPEMGTTIASRCGTCARVARARASQNTTLEKILLPDATYAAGSFAGRRIYRLGQR